ncbi:type II toxin-antitoxin system RelE/ParE family toxin [Collimonas sp. NPDC087041]|uniref:type II toxin-antitoxin system RelE/ParE family toxin n=1 Tax=Collimonas sp. NPDC087041 TaxID=3363960 RepID=UPI003821850F
MFEILLSDLFKRWLHDLRDAQGKASILRRIRAIGFGNFGSFESVGDGISELRIHTGPGYRVYFTRRDKTLLLLLLGGDKSSQKKDIKLAKEMLKSLRE